MMSTQLGSGSGVEPRVGSLVPAALTADQADLYAAILGGPRSAGPQHFSLTSADGSLAGPFNALLLSPSIGASVQELGAAIRYRSHLSDRVREMAILVVAAKWQSAFEMAAHEAVGRAVGVTDAELTDIAAGRQPALADPVEGTSVRLAHAMSKGDVDDELWVSARRVLSERTIFELVTLVGYYSGLALQMRVFRADG